MSRIMRHITVRFLYLALAALLPLPPSSVAAASYLHPRSVSPATEQVSPAGASLAVAVRRPSIYLPVSLVGPPHRQTPAAPASDSSPSSHLDQTPVYTYFLSYTVGSVTLHRPSNQIPQWDFFGGLSGPLQAKAYGVVLYHSTNNPAITGKRMHAWHLYGAGWQGPTAFEDTSDVLTNGYYCTAHHPPIQGGWLTPAQICSLVAPTATVIINGNNLWAVDPGDVAIAAFAAHGNSLLDSGDTTISGLRWIYYGIPFDAVEPDRTALSDPHPKTGQGDPRECPVTACNEAQGYVGDPINTYSGGFRLE